MRQTRHLFRAALAACLVTAGPAIARPGPIATAVADPARPADERALDATRHPADLLAAAGIRRGETVVDFFPGGYFDRMFAGIVGAKGHVVLFVPDELPADDRKGLPVPGDHPYAPNVSVIDAPANSFAIPGGADIIWIRQNYHDLYDKFMAPADVPTVNRAMFKALKLGGRLVIIDHAAVAGSGIAATDTLHRIDEARVKADMAAAGFRLVKEIDVLRNPADPRDRLVFDASIRGHTDQFVLVFRKPA